MNPSEDTFSNRVVFVSDWHLPPEHTAQTDFFVRFAEEVCKGADRLFVLGDLFAAWVGPKHISRAGHAPVLEALRRLASSGPTVTVLWGNRDFLLDSKVTQQYGLELAGDVWRGRLGGKRARLSHGDELTEDDRLHKALRAAIGNFPISTLVKAMPTGISGVLAGAHRWLSSERRTRRKRKNLRPAESVMRADFESGTDLIVIAHWHEPSIQADAFGMPGKTLVRLGECTDTEAVYAEMTDETIQLKHFPVARKEGGDDV